MTTPNWTAGTLYAPGAVVQRNTAPTVVSQPPDNADFELGDVNWTKDAPWGIDTYESVFTGTWSARCRGTKGDFRIYSNTVAVVPGMTITASCMIRRHESGAKGRIQLEWLDSGSSSLRIDDGTLIDSGFDKWKESSVTGVAPANAAYVRVGAKATLNSTTVNLFVDAFKWNYAYSPPIDSLIFTAVQAAPGYSGAIEPVWPTVNGAQVVDNEVTWEAIDSSTVTWEASPILVSGATEPSFPTEVGGTVSDNTIVWTAISRRVEDEKCPNTKIVAIAASKIFCADDDIIAYSATVNPLDWSTTDDAGYLPFGLQTYGSNPVAALGLYRSNLVAFNATGFQMWQVDPDPQQMALLDAAPIGCRYYLSLKPFQNDLAFLSDVGVRNISIAGASTNLEAGVFGKPVDPLVKDHVKAGLYEPYAAFLPSFGQYWIVWGVEAVVMTTTGLKQMSWSRYVFPAEIDTTTILGEAFYIRTADDTVWLLTEDELDDDVYCQPDAPTLYGSTDTGALSTDLWWGAVSYTSAIEAYVVLRAEVGGLFSAIATLPGNTLTYTDTTCVAGTDYEYVVIARPASGQGIDSEHSDQYLSEFPAV